MALGSHGLKPSKTQSAPKTGSPSSSLAFDWAYTGLFLLLTTGVYMDGWSHVTFGPDQSVFSEYHLLFYSSATTLGLFLFGNSYRYLRQGYRGPNAIPKGYLIGFIGLIVFGIGGVLDLTGHALFGFETGMEVLLSPTHITLFTGGAMMATAPAKAAVRKYQSKQPSFQEFLPAVISWTLFANALAFGGLVFFPTIGNAWMLSANRTTVDFLGHSLGVFGILAQSILLVGTCLWLIHSFKLPRGTFTIFFTLFGSLSAIISFTASFIPTFVITGIIADLLYMILKPSSRRGLQLYTFGFAVPFTFWAVFYLFAFQADIQGGVWYSNYIWIGSIVEAGIVGLLISYLSNYAAPLTPSQDDD